MSNRVNGLLHQCYNIIWMQVIEFVAVFVKKGIVLILHTGRRAYSYITDAFLTISLYDAGRVVWALSSNLEKIGTDDGSFYLRQ